MPDFLTAQWGLKLGIGRSASNVPLGAAGESCLGGGDGKTPDHFAPS